MNKYAYRGGRQRTKKTLPDPEKADSLFMGNRREYAALLIGVIAYARQNNRMMAYV